MDSFIPEFGHIHCCTKGVLVKYQKQNGRQCRFRWDEPSHLSVFCMQRCMNALVCRDERANKQDTLGKLFRHFDFTDRQHLWLQVCFPVSKVVDTKRKAFPPESQFYMVLLKFIHWAYGYSCRLLRHVSQEDSFYDFLFAFLHMKSLLKMGLFYKGRFCSQRE